MTFDNLRDMNKRAGRSACKVWKADEVEQRKIISSYLKLCSSKLTINDLDSIKQVDMKRVIDEIVEGEITLEELGQKTGDELYDYIVRQERLFE